MLALNALFYELHLALLRRAGLRWAAPRWAGLRRAALRRTGLGAGLRLLALLRLPMLGTTAAAGMEAGSQGDAYMQLSDDDNGGCSMEIDVEPGAQHAGVCACMQRS
jgi:hypothetical protein